YYHPFEEQHVDEQGVQNFDLPEAIDHARFGTDLAALRAGRAVTLKEYTFNNPAAEAATLRFEPAPVVIVEGLFVFYYSEVRALLDLKLFVEAPEHLKLKRRLLRDLKERGYDQEDVLYRYEHHVAPAYERYVAPYRHNADLVIPNRGGCERALTVVAHFLQAKAHDQ
ncbi:MAG: uridine kinase, partial [Catalinimonas sp.]